MLPSVSDANVFPTERCREEREEKDVCSRPRAPSSVLLSFPVSSHRLTFPLLAAALLASSSQSSASSPHVTWSFLLLTLYSSLCFPLFSPFLPSVHFISAFLTWSRLHIFHLSFLTFPYRPFLLSLLFLSSYRIAIHPRLFPPLAYSPSYPRLFHINLFHSSLFHLGPT